MRKILLLMMTVSFAVLGSVGAYAAAEDDLAQKKVLAQDFFEVRPVSDAADFAIAQIAQTKPEAERNLFIKQMRLNMDYARLEAEMTKVLVNTYSAEEIKAMTVFYGSDVGKAIMDKQSSFQQGVSNVLSTMLDEAFMKANYGNNGLQSRP